MNKNLGHSEKKMFNKHFQGANSELNSLYQGGPGTEPEPETGTVGTVFAGTERGNRNRRNRSRGTENPLLRGTAGTENRNRSNRSIPKP